MKLADRTECATRRTAVTLVLGVGVLPAWAQSDRASAAASGAASTVESPASAPTGNALPAGGVEWFVAGVAVGVIVTLAWVKIRGGGHGNGNAAAA